jgi:glycosyltransferase involved in cell wall biosynthesis
MPVIVATDFAYVNGGAGQIALGSAKGLAERGHEVILFTGAGPIAPDLVAVRQLRHECLDQVSVWDDRNVAGGAMRGIWNLAAMRRMRTILDSADRRSTVVHLHSWTKVLSASVVHAAVSCGVPVVATLHDYFTVCPAGTLFDHNRGACCDVAPMSLACLRANCDARSYAHKLWRVARHAVQSSLAGLPGAVRDLISVSDTSVRLMRPFLPSDARLHRVPNFAEVPQSAPVPVEQNQAMVYVGRLSAEKGALLCAAAADRLHVPAVFIGDGPQTAGVRERCAGAEMTGWLSPSDVRACLRQKARALVFPSIWHETQGLVVSEAAAMGIPAIVPDTSAASEWVEDGVSGFWFRSGDEDDLVRKMAALIDDPRLAQRLGRAAYDRFWAAPPTLDRHLDAVERVYDAVLRGVARHLPEPALHPNSLQENQ